MNSFDMRVDHSSALDQQASSGSDSAAKLWLAAMDETGLDENGHPKAAATPKPDSAQPPADASKPADTATTAPSAAKTPGWEHVWLTGASFVPVVGAAASAYDCKLYHQDGDDVNAAISCAAAAVGVFSDAGAAKVGLKLGAEALSVGRAGETAAKVVEAGREADAATGLADATHAAGGAADVGKVSGADGEAILLSKSKFGHTFTTHGQDATAFLTNRARAMGEPNGQFLDDQAAARFIQDNLNKAKGGPVSIPLPEGFPARVINPDGSFSPARSIRLVPGGKGVKTAFPEP